MQPKNRPSLEETIEAVENLQTTNADQRVQALETLTAWRDAVASAPQGESDDDRSVKNCSVGADASYDDK